MSARKHQLLAAAFAITAATRADRWLRPFARGLGVILTLHHVRPWTERTFAPNRFLEITPEFLDWILRLLRQEGFEIVPLGEVPARLRLPRPARPFAVLTFDDGYRDNLVHAWPVLKRHRAPWTLFVVPRFMDHVGMLWWIALEQAIESLDRVVITWQGQVQSMSTQTLSQKERAFARIRHLLQEGSQADLQQTCGDLAAQADVDTQSLVRRLCAGWHDILDLAQDPDVTIGSHTMRHPILSRISDDAAAREVSESKSLLEHRLRRPVQHIAYPHGDKASVGAREFAMVQRSGYVTGLTTRPGHLFPPHAERLNALPRISINGLHQNASALRALLSGVPFIASNMFGGRG